MVLDVTNALAAAQKQPAPGEKIVNVEAAGVTSVEPVATEYVSGVKEWDVMSVLLVVTM